MVTSALNEEDKWATSITADGYGPDRGRAQLAMVEDLVRAIITAAPGNRIEVVVNGNRVQIGGEQMPDWLRKIIE